MEEGDKIFKWEWDEVIVKKIKYRRKLSTDTWWEEHSNRGNNKVRQRFYDCL